MEPRRSFWGRIPVVPVALILTGLLGILCAILGLTLLDEATLRMGPVEACWRFLALAVVALLGAAVGWRFLVQSPGPSRGPGNEA